MANISITAECNQSCACCFARGTFAEGESPEMSQEAFEAALDLLERSEVGQMRLLGGEPTLHPSFPRMLEQATERDLEVLVFSNGLIPEQSLTALEKIDEGAVKVLVNVTAGPGNEAGDGQKVALARLGKRAIVGANISRPGMPLRDLLEAIDRFDLSRVIRLGLAQPRAEGDNRWLHPRLYRVVGEEIAGLMRMAAERDVELQFDCGFVPCMFPQSALDTISGLDPPLGMRCGAIPDILPDGRVIACYPLSSLAHVKMADGASLEALREQLNGKLAAYRSVQVYGECVGCPLLADDRCRGGCLSAAMQRMRRGPFELAQEHTPCGAARAPRSDKAQRERAVWSIPWVDQPPAFWEAIRDDYGEQIGEVYLPLPVLEVGSGRPLQPSDYLLDFIKSGVLPISVLVNPIVLTEDARDIAPELIEAVRRLRGTACVRGATVANADLGRQMREAFPDLTLTASTLMDIARPNQVLMIADIFDALVPSSRIMRDLPALSALREAFSGRIRLIVNEGCLPGCPFRTQHFFEMAHAEGDPPSLCEDLLAREPWLRVTGSFVLPQHLHLYHGVFDELKLAGRVTLRDPDRYLSVLGAYVEGRVSLPAEIGGGPASIREPINIDEDFFAATLTCDHGCHECRLCRDYYENALNDIGATGAGGCSTHPTEEVGADVC